LLRDEAEYLLLVHGTLTRPLDRPYSHAWLLDPRTGVVYDPVKDRCFDEAEYNRLYQADAWHIYSQDQVYDLICQNKTLGPWDERLWDALSTRGDRQWKPLTTLSQLSSLLSKP
jgi:hypothetical protein